MSVRGARIVLKLVGVAAAPAFTLFFHTDAEAQTFSPAQPDTETVIERDVDEESSENESAEAMRRMLNVDGNDFEGPVTLEADEIEYEPASQTVVALGNVEVFFNGRALRADMITYDGGNDRISAVGDIEVVNEDGSVIVADSAEFDSEIRDGLIRGAKAVLADGQARMAAVEARRVDGKFTQLSKAVFSPCEVCEDGGAPLWQIRARKIVQDEEARDIIYEDATFEVFGTPVAYLPYFRHPDPTVTRRTGFLPPEFSSTNELGFATRVPYFIELGSNRDMTVAAYAFTDENPVLETEYRALVESGSYELFGSFTYAEDFDPKGESENALTLDALEDGFRGHFEGDGRFALGLGYDFDIGFDALIASDDTYLRRYRYTNVDRTQARGFVERFQDDGFVSAETIRYQSFREDEPSGEIPLIAPLIEFEQFYDAPLVGGELSVGGNNLYLQRTAGRDVSRLIGELGWRRGFSNQFGVLVDTTASLRGDIYRTFDDDDFEDDAQTRVLPLASVTASWPLGKTTESSSQVVEPIAQLVWAPYGGNPSEIPNEDSQDTELDDLNIFAINRFAGVDRWEDGPRATFGLRYNRFAFGGAELEASIGQSFRLRSTDAFSDNSGLDGTTSDVVGAWRISASPFYTVGQRFRVDDDGFQIERNEVYASAEFFERFRLSSSYVFLESDVEAGSEDDRTEANLAAAFDITGEWTIAGDVRRDLEESRFVTAGGALRYANECCEVDLTVRRRFNEVDDVPPSTDFGLVVRLKGLGTP